MLSWLLLVPVVFADTVEFRVNDGPIYQHANVWSPYEFPVEAMEGDTVYARVAREGEYSAWSTFLIAQAQVEMDVKKKVSAPAETEAEAVQACEAQLEDADSGECTWVWTTTRTGTVTK